MTDWLRPSERYLCIKIANFLNHYHPMDAKTHATVVYRLNGWLMTGIKIAITLILSYFLGIIKYHVVFAFAYGFLRTYSHGIHFKSKLTCFLIGNLTYYSSIYFSIYVRVPLLLHYIILSILIFIFIKLAPAISRQVIIRENAISMLKRKIRLILFCLTTLQIFLHFKSANTMAVILLSAMAVQAINILPISILIVEGKEVEK